MRRFFLKTVSKESFFDGDPLERRLQLKSPQA
jgi:hypothetical protein